MAARKPSPDKKYFTPAQANAMLPLVRRIVQDITELRHKPLEVCDGLSRRVGTIAQSLATVEGALTGAGGVWTAHWIYWAAPISGMVLGMHLYDTLRDMGDAPGNIPTGTEGPLR